MSGLFALIAVAAVAAVVVLTVRLRAERARRTAAEEKARTIEDGKAQTAADRRVRRWIRSLTSHIREFVLMRIHRNAPRLEQMIDRADVIEMGVRQHDRLRRCLAEVLRRPATDPPG